MIKESASHHNIGIAAEMGRCQKRIHTWGGMNSGMVAMSPYNNKLIPANLIQEAVNMEVALKDGSIHAFDGPIYNQAGELVVPKGQVADDGMLLGMSFYVQGIDGDIPQ